MNATRVSFIAAQVFLGGIMLTGGIMHFTIDPVTAYRDDFLTAINATGYLWQLIGAVEIVCAIAILARRYMPLALLLLGPITTIIFTLHVSQVGKVVHKPGGMYVAVPLLLAHLVLVWHCRAHYRGLLAPKLQSNI